MSTKRLFTSAEEMVIFEAVSQSKKDIPTAIKESLLDRFPSRTYNQIQNKAYILLKLAGLQTPTAKKLQERVEKHREAQGIKDIEEKAQEYDVIAAWHQRKRTQGMGPNIARPLWFDDKEAMIKRAGGRR